MEVVSRGAAPAPVAPVEPQVQETPVEATPQQADPMSKHYAALARKEREIRNQMRAVKEREQALKAKEQEYQTNYIPKSRLLDSPLDVLTEAGMSYDDLVQRISSSPNQNDPTVIALKQLQRKLDAIEQNSQTAQKQMEEAQNQAVAQAKKQMEYDAKIELSGNDDFELINELGHIPSVINLAEHIFHHGLPAKNGKGWEFEPGFIPDIKAVAAVIEDELVEDSMKRASFKKIKNRMTPQQVNDQSMGVIPQRPAGLKTITNQVSASTSKSMSEKERRERAIAAMEGRLR
jgi:hypothetical protein